MDTVYSHIMKARMILAVSAALLAGGAVADFSIGLDLSGKPMRDLSKTTVGMEPYEGMPRSDTLNLEIGPHTLQSVTVTMRNVPKEK